MEILNDEDDNTIIERSTFNDAYEVLENYEELKKSNISKFLEHAQNKSVVELSL